MLRRAPSSNIWFPTSPDIWFSGFTNPAYLVLVISNSRNSSSLPCTALPMGDDSGQVDFLPKYKIILYWYTGLHNLVFSNEKVTSPEKNVLNSVI